MHVRNVDVGESCLVLLSSSGLWYVQCDVVQAKRTNIGIAMITNPRVLFLDEPTSGLDSYTANEVTFPHSLYKEHTFYCFVSYGDQAQGLLLS